ncbi:hypothetical protein B0H14DRAFT_2626324 [Mycena olivaceomarginata]|nr:hypothetical protein B0H14DRAFT_2626324 [Mycena olivaceomarginata]
MTGKREGHPCCGLHSWSVDQIDTSQAAQGRGRCRGLLLLQATFWVLEALEVEQEQAGQIYWSAFDGDGMKEGGARCWRQNRLVASASRDRLDGFMMECIEVCIKLLPAKQYRKAGGAGDIHIEGHI